MAVAGDTLFWATVDCHLLAIDTKTGRVIWDQLMADWRKGYQFNVAPLIVRDMVILGPATNEAGANCWVVAYDVKTGKELWRFYTAPCRLINRRRKRGRAIPGSMGARLSGTAALMTPKRILLSGDTGNPNPGWNGDPRLPGDNLSSTSGDNLSTPTA